MDEINDMERLIIKHMSVKYENGNLSYTRKLEDGPGADMYGLEVCKSLDLEKNFIKLATTIRQEILGTNILLKNKKSKYNSKLI